MGDQILQFLGEVTAYGGGASVIAYLMFRYLGKSWIENKFAERIEDFKHQQAIEIQRLRVEIDSTLSGVLKIQDKEFETLPQAWSRLDEAYSHVTALVSPLQQYPNLDRMTPPQIEEFLAQSELLETQKDEIRESETKVKTYQEVIFWHRLHKVRKICFDLQSYVIRFGIFFPPELKESFDKIVEALRLAVSDKEIGHEAKDYKLQNEGWTKIKDEIQPLFKEIEEKIHARLQSHGRNQAAPAPR